MRTVYYDNSFEPDSSVIAGVYFDSLNSELFIELTSGNTCGYKGVGYPLFEDFSMAESAGVYWNSYIKNNPWFTGISGDVDLRDASLQQTNQTNPAEPVSGTKYVITYTPIGSQVMTVNGAKDIDDALRIANITGKIEKIEIIYND